MKYITVTTAMVFAAIFLGTTVVLAESEKKEACEETRMSCLKKHPYTRGQFGSYGWSPQVVEKCGKVYQSCMKAKK